MKIAHTIAQLSTGTLISACVLTILYDACTAYTPFEQANSNDLDTYLEDLVNDGSGIIAIPEQETSQYLPTEKRYASLSYYYGNGRSRGRSRSPRYYRNRYYKSNYYKNYYQPWLILPDKECLRDRCSTDNDCCRRYSKCDKSAHVCYSCWYSHPCKTSRDCCERYPYCNKHRGGICQA